jgi:hypothetical protein
MLEDQPPVNVLSRSADKALRIQEFLVIHPANLHERSTLRA